MKLFPSIYGRPGQSEPTIYIRKNLYIPWFRLTIFGPDYYLVHTFPRIRRVPSQYGPGNVQKQLQVCFVQILRLTFVLLCVLVLQIT